MNNPLDFSGKAVLVTGSSRGLGAEMIRAFGAHGAQCVCELYRRSRGTEPVRRRFRDRQLWRIRC